MREIIELFYVLGIVHFSVGCSKTPPKLRNLKKKIQNIFLDLEKMVKKKSKLNSEKIRTKKLKEKKVNPFELKVIKSKRDTLNTKIRKHQISKPGQSRVKNRQIQVQISFLNSLIRGTCDKFYFRIKQSVLNGIREIEKMFFTMVELIQRK